MEARDDFMKTFMAFLVVLAVLFVFWISASKNPHHNMAHKMVKKVKVHEYVIQNTIENISEFLYEIEGPNNIHYYYSSNSPVTDFSRATFTQTTPREISGLKEQKELEIEDKELPEELEHEQLPEEVETPEVEGTETTGETESGETGDAGDGRDGGD